MTKKSAKSKSPKKKPAAQAAPSGLLLMDALIQAAHASGRVLNKYRIEADRHSLKISEKPDAGLVTNADLESEAACVKILRKAQPGFGFLTEESPPQKSQNGGRWIIDPLDGTTNFVHGFPMYCVSLAAEWNGEVIAGVIYHPILKEMYSAIRGKGAYLNSKRIHVSKTARLEDSLLTTGFTYLKQDHLNHEMHSFQEMSRVARAIRRPGSAALDLAYTARGVFDGFWERSLSAWDVAAGALLVQEAGGKVTDFEGKPFRVDGPSVVATNGKLHRPILRSISSRAD